MCHSSWLRCSCWDRAPGWIRMAILAIVGSLSIPDRRLAAGSSDIAQVNALEHGSGAIADTKLGQYYRDVILDRALAGFEKVGNLAVTEASRHETQHLLLAASQRIGQICTFKIGGGSF